MQQHRFDYIKDYFLYASIRNGSQHLFVYTLFNDPTLE